MQGVHIIIHIMHIMGIQSLHITIHIMCSSTLGIHFGGPFEFNILTPRIFHLHVA